MQPGREARKDWASLSFRFAANRNHVLKHLSRFPDIEHRLCFISTNVDADFAHRFDRERIDGPGLKPGTLSF